MTTPNFNLPLITGNMTADVPRDMNALAEATDGAITQVGNQLTEHLNEGKQYVVFEKTLNQSVASMITTNVSWTTIENFNGADYCRLENGNIFVNEDGLYELSVILGYASNGSGHRQVGLKGSFQTSTNAVQNGNTFIALTNTIEYQTGQQVSVNAYQTSSVALDLIATTCKLKIRKVASL
ncbi:hypothetical protein BFM98_00170 [Lysinibacillus sp. AR18-8]|uniref:hypothetical protein n=1 Tax=Lysinibacillus sp. AR18-8 TaxID=1889781 RepID=UPI000826A5A2|nr:hypothetical protein [Lysinibacillus sp. AR18-8]OCX65489.1 hypothetical protein BFM98_00170 [Lysinibacillus sp. AR18-8]